MVAPGWPCFAPKGPAINATGDGASAAAALTTRSFAAIYRRPKSATKLYHGGVKGGCGCAASSSRGGMRLLSAVQLISISERDYLRLKGSAAQPLQRKSPPFKSCTVVLESRAIYLLQVTRRTAAACLMISAAPAAARPECGESRAPRKKTDEVFRPPPAPRRHD